MNTGKLLSDSNSEDNHFVNTPSAEEKRLLATLPADKARVLQHEISERNRKRFLGVDSHLSKAHEFFFKGFNPGLERPDTIG